MSQLLKHPTEGAIRMQDLLWALGFVVNHKRVRRLLRLMGLKKHIHYYNYTLYHQGIDRRIPANLYKPAA